MDPRLSVLDAGDPGGRFHEFACLVFLRVLPEVPNITVIVLSEERELFFDQLTLGEVLDVGHDGAYTQNFLSQIGDCDLHAVRHLLSALGCIAVVDPFRPGLQWVPFVVDIRRLAELRGVEVGELRFRLSSGGGFRRRVSGARGCGAGRLWANLVASARR